MEMWDEPDKTLVHGQHAPQVSGRSGVAIMQIWAGVSTRECTELKGPTAITRRRDSGREKPYLQPMVMETTQALLSPSSSPSLSTSQPRSSGVVSLPELARISMTRYS